MSAPIEELVHAYVALHNRGIRSGDFSAMIELFHVNAELHFEGIPFGPCLGKRAVAEAFSAHPPDDELVVLSVTVDSTDQATAVYAWLTKCDVAAGTLQLSATGDHIMELRITNSPTASTP
jgi:hypothetical protein